MAGPPDLEIRVLGELAVLEDGRPVELPRSKRARALLAYLAVTGRRHRRDRLCAMFWHENDDPRAALRWSLSRLRAAIDRPGRPRVIADRDSVALDGAGVATDLATMRAALTRGPESVSTETLHDAAEQFRGDFLEGLDLPDCHGFQSWCIAERENARRLRVRLLTRLVDRPTATPDQALPFARTLSLLEPDDEAVQTMLLRLLRASGRRGEAEAHYRAAVRRFDALDPAASGALRQAWWTLPIRERQEPQQVRHCRTADAVRIAYTVVGRGPPLVRAAHWLGHLDFERESPVWRHWTDNFAETHRFIRYDERGSGLSDWDVADISLDGFVRDLEAVVDALELDRFPLIGSSKGGPTAIAYAVRHPERVTHLILLGTFAQGAQRRNPAAAARQEALVTLVRDGWAQDNPAYRQIFTTRFMPDATAEEARWFNDLQRVSASAENAIRLIRAIGDIDIVALLPRVAVPTLVLHCRDDGAIPFEQGRLLASRIPGARFIALGGSDHILLPRNPAWSRFVAELQAFLAGPPRPRTAPSKRRPARPDRAAPSRMPSGV
jgi:DNA-binding SARP family transcriptional activator/alpha-beta hydrolase superfamily lysophospholipase